MDIALAHKSIVTAGILASSLGLRVAPRSALIVLMLATAELSGGPAVADPVTPQALAAVVAKDPGYLPIIPNFTSYHAGRALPISAADAKAGVIAEFEVLFDYMVPNTVTGITYRVFRDTATAQSYYEGQSILKQPGFPDMVVVVDSTGTVSNEGSSVAITSMKCQTYYDPHHNNQVTARCAALSKSAPVLVDGVRIQNPSRPLQVSNGVVSYPVNSSDVQAATTTAGKLVGAGMNRIGAEYALLAAGDFVKRH